MPSFISIFKVALGFMAGLLCIELALQFMPTATGFQRSSEPFPIRHWKPNTTYQYSNGWNFRNPQSGHINNYGFVNVKDYDSPKADVLVIGDSYIEAQQVTQDMTLHAVIEQQTGLNTYSIGINDSQFADYIHYMRYGMKTFTPDWLVIKLFASDLQYSFNSAMPQGAYFETSENGLNIKINPPRANSALRNQIKKSALLRYVFLNLRLPAQIKRLLSKPTTPPAFNAAQYQPLITFFDDELRQHNLDKSRVIFITDSDQVSALLDQNQFKHVHSERILTQMFATTGFRGNDEPYDGHWNFRGHYQVGQAISALLIPN